MGWQTPEDVFQEFLGILFICSLKAYNFLILKKRAFVSSKQNLGNSQVKVRF